MENLELELHVSEKEFGASICDSLKRELGIDLKAIYASGALQPSQMMNLAAVKLQEAIFNRAHQENYKGFFLDSELESGNFAKATETEPNIAFEERFARELTMMQGENVKGFVYNLVKRFENMAVAKSPEQLVAEMLGSAVMAVGVSMGIAVVQNLLAGQALGAAMLGGITSLGMATAITAITVVLAGLLYYLLVDNPKKILGLVVNNSDEDFIVRGYRHGGGDLHMEHGQMVNFMEDYQNGLQSRMIQLKQRLSFGEKHDENFVFAGLYFSDRNVGFRGSEGVMLFSSTQRPDLTIAHMFAVPYTKDNRTFITFVHGRPNLSHLFRDLYNQDRERVDMHANNYRLTSTVNSRRGGVVACIATINVLEH